MDRSRPVRPVTLTGSEIVLVARVAVNALRGLGLECVLVGGAACGAFGSSLIAKNVDIVVLSADVGREEIKRRMAARDSNFFLASPETPHATYKVLWYDISPTVNILAPGVMNIPDVPQGCAVIASGQWWGLPLMPLIPLLMLRLQDWMEHRKPGVRFSRRSVENQRNDEFLTIGDLLDVGVRRGYTLDAYRAWLPVSLLETAEEQIPTYNIYHPMKAGHWQRLGFSAASAQGWLPNGVFSASQMSQLSESLAKMNI
ncbi:hypothetical protein EYR36_006750 [Pleurotus pulmonarius]|nr:hypothetical protein EYR36_006750 [Pleurotus pulmonarius]KAF4601449.1 hypothetical protein EYR38_006102 [Pleurotus pulmonarius]